MVRALLLGLPLFVVLTGATVESLDALTGRTIEATVAECEHSHGNCKWHVRAGDPLASFHRTFTFLPGLLVYPLAPVAALAAWQRSHLRQGWKRLGWRLLAFASLLVLLRFFWLGVFTAATR
ncbi:MAG: hypothetical protein ACOZQL_38950 [Myxococcota bacterium]